MKKKKEHRHKWEYHYNDCAKCGGYEERYCEIENCYKVQINEDGKWEDL